MTGDPIENARHEFLQAAARFHEEMDRTGRALTAAMDDALRRCNEERAAIERGFQGAQDAFHAVTTTSAAPGPGQGRRRRPPPAPPIRRRPPPPPMPQPADGGRPVPGGLTGGAAVPID